MGKKQITVAGTVGLVVGGALLTHAQSAGDSNGDGFLEFSDGAVIDATELNTNFNRTSAHVTTYEEAIEITSSGEIGLRGSPLDDESLFIYQDESGLGDHLNLRLYKLEGGKMVALTDGVDYELVSGINATSNYGYLGDSSAAEILVLKDGNVGIGTTTPISGKLHLYSSGGNDYEGGLAVERSGAASTGRFYVDSNNVLAITRGGGGTTSGRVLALDGSGMVGIGTASPASGNELHINAQSGNSSDLRMTAGDGTALTFKAATGTTAAAIEADNNLYLQLDGNVGIGTTTPQARLDVAGTIRANELCDEGGVNCLDISGGFGTSSQWTTTGTGDSIYYSGAAVGIGTNSPGYLLHVKSGDLFIESNSDPTLGFGHDDDTIFASISRESLTGKLFIRNDQGNEIILDNGYVGVGTTDPQYPLHVSGEVKLGVTYIGNASDTWGRIDYGGGGSNDQFILYAQAGKELRMGAGGTYDDIVVQADGDVGIGTTAPGAKLHVSSTGPVINLQDVDNLGTDNAVYGYVSFKDSNNSEYGWVGDGSSGANYIGLFDNRASGQIHLGTNTASRLVINSSGNVGIGTTSPAFRTEIRGGWLYVAGSGHTSGDQAMRIGVYDTDNTGGVTGWWFSQNNDGKFALHQDAVGDRIVVDGSGRVGIGTGSPGYTLDVNGSLRAFGITDSSDLRLKTDIQPLKHASEGINCLQAVTYRWQDPGADQGLQIGLIAQEVEGCFPEIVSTDDQGFKSVAYARLVAPLVETAKEQLVLNKKQEQTIASQQRALATQQQRITALEAEHAALKAQLARIEASIQKR